MRWSCSLQRCLVGCCCIEGPKSRNGTPNPWLILVSQCFPRVSQGFPKGLSNCLSYLGHSSGCIATFGACGVPSKMLTPGRGNCQIHAAVVECDPSRYGGWGFESWLKSGTLHAPICPMYPPYVEFWLWIFAFLLFSVLAC